MLTTDLALRVDPVYEQISRRFLEHPDEFADAFARAWFKLTHRDMGPLPRYLGPLVPQEELLWQDPVPAVDHELVDADDIAALKAQGARLRPDGVAAGVDGVGVGLDASAAATSAAAPTAAASGCSRRAAGRSTTPTSSPPCCAPSRASSRSSTARSTGGKKISLADLIVLAGCAGVEQAAKDAGHDVEVPFTPGRTDASQEQTDVESFAPLEPTADGFRNYLRQGAPAAGRVPAGRQGQPADAERPGDDRPRRRPASHSAPTPGSRRSASSPTRPGTLTNDFFVNLLDLRHDVAAGRGRRDLRRARRGSGEVTWTGSRVDLVFGSNSELRALAEVYASDDAKEKFVRDFVAAWDKVMNLDRYDLPGRV